MDKALVLLSGGIDSTTCLYLAKKQYETYALTMNYYNRIEKEIESSRVIAAVTNTKLIEIDIPFIKELFNITNEKDSRLSYYIPSKNLIFYSIAAHYAEYMKVRWIIGGHNNDDQFYLDAKMEYIESLNAILKNGSMLHNDYQIITPLIKLSKFEVIKLANELSVPFELTWSCYRRGNKHCGKCHGCLSRIEIFDRLGIKDPVEYEMLL